eukprot:PITA_02243
MGSSSYFPTEDKLHDKFDYHGWKMYLDLTLEEKELMDYMQGKIPDQPSNAPATAKTKYNKAEVKMKKIIRDSIDKHLMAYISELKTSKEIYDRLVGMFKVSNTNQTLFLKNKLKDIRKGKDKDIQSYFLRITGIKNDLLFIGEVIPDKELTLTTLGGLPPEWGNFSNIDQKNDRSIGKGKRNVGHQGNGRPSKKSRNSRYDASNVVNNKKKEYYLISALSTASPPDTSGNWLIDSGASRHFTRYKESLSNLIEKETNLEIILGDDATFPVK